MKLSTIIRAIARPWVRVYDSDDRTWFMFDPENIAGPGFGVSVSNKNRWAKRATVRKVGDLEIAWWGRDTLVHPVEAS